ncbi:MAG: RpiB/LacA/LacB family sugar-phosphate isomerase [Patescibacteria group bacterium]
MIYLAADHAGFKLKEVISQFLDFLHLEYVDLGADSEVPTDDYPDFARKLAKKIGKKDKGFLFCGTGSGMCMMANRYSNVRAVVGAMEHEVVMGRSENDANVLCLGSRFINEHTAKKYVKAFLDIPFSGETRHKRRIKKLEKR